MTNFERIKAMNIEELAEVIHCAGDNICFEVCEKDSDNKFLCPYETEEPKNCIRCIVIWLESEVTK